MSRAARLLLKPWALALLVLLGLGASEAAVRVVDARRGYSPRARAAWYWLFEQDPLLGYRGRAGAEASIRSAALPLNSDSVRHTAEGFRDRRSFAELFALKGRRLVVCVGDADTYGLTAGANDRTYPALLERELRARSGDARWVVFNAGVPGYTTSEVLQLLKLQLLKLKPEAVVAMSLRRDHENVTIFLDEALDYDRYPLRLAALSSSRVSDFFMRSALVGRAAERWRDRWWDDLGGRYPMRAYGEMTARGRQLFLDNVDLTARLCRRHGARLLWVDQPMHYSTCNYGQTQIDSVERLRADLRAQAAESGLSVLEAHQGFDWTGVEARGDMLLGSNEQVLGPEGYQRLAERLAPQILALLGP
jgi:lysophospholipase L1-like esterase